jgi:hypothetical protein
MTRTEFKKWKDNGTFTVSQNRILEVANDIAEGYFDNFTKKEATEAVTYFALEHSAALSRIAAKETDRLVKAFHASIRRYTKKKN